MAGEEASKFMEIYSNLPFKTRRETVAVIDGEPYSWDVAHKEIESDTELGKKILKRMKEMKIV